ncbi:sensor histidine kinase [Hahella ganghwensis]|uniref:sensor histidine kinase n=1 Tax=Hahella ganghwensis TaxID=286420 RepID=UPI0003658B2D|nr:HAMP domain-containing sensor histidine kinase [Hahella ganghwensis]
MRRHLRHGLTPWRLRLVLSLLFLALVIPSAVLIWQTQRQIKWEAFHQYRLLAEELAGRIDSELQKAIAREEAHSYADYQFLVLAGDPVTSSFVERSPLARYPVTSEIPGVIGYFQVDADGTFTTPLLPVDLTSTDTLGLSADEITERSELRDRLLDVLSQNQLVPRQRSPERDRMVVLSDADQGSPQIAIQNDDEGDEISSSYEVTEPAAIAQRMESPEAEAAPAPETSNYSQQVFDKLSAAESLVSSPKSQTKARVEDLKLKREAFIQSEEMAAKEYQQKKQTVAEERKQREAPAEAGGFQTAPRASRKEQTALLESNTFPYGTGNATPEDKIRIFESEIDPFELALLESGEFVLFRKVWRDGERLIQGTIIEQGALIEGLMGEMFLETALSQMSDLVVAYQGNVLNVIAGTEAGYRMRSSSELSGTLLHQVRLSSPFGEFQLLWSIKRLPAGPGATVVAWASLILFAVLIVGFWVLYRLGMKQILMTRQQQDFVSSVSHELKTPLTSIRMYGEMLREGWVSDEKKLEYYDFIHDESERLSRLIANVLQLARMERNDLNLELKPYSVRSLMDMVKSKIHSQVERAGFECSYDIETGIEDLELLIDPDAFTQIIINLVDNGIKFSSQADIRKIDIRAVGRGGKGVVWSVRDYGPGIAKSQMKKIFQLFYRSGSELTRETIGTGIGLALVRQLTRAMGGEVDVIKQSPGAEFQVKLARR